MQSSTRHAPDGFSPPDWSFHAAIMRRSRDGEQGERRHTLVLLFQAARHLPRERSFGGAGGGAAAAKAIRAF
jgi:hypothetical protein